MNLAALDLRPLYYFVQVSVAGSFSRASASLSVAQPVLSRFIRRLEDELGVQLLHRNGRGVRLTEAGERLHVQATEILRQLSQAHLEVAAMRGAPIGQVTVALPPLMGGVLAAPLLQRVRAEQPLISISLREGFAAEALDWLGSGSADIGVLFKPPNVSTLITEHVIDDRIHLLGPPGSLDVAAGEPVPAARLAELDMILPPEPHRLRALVQDAAREAGLNLVAAVEVTGTNTILELVREGVGYAVMPSSLLIGEKARGHIDSWPICDPVIPTRLFIATSMQKPQTLATKAVLRIISEVLAKTLREFRTSEARLSPGG